MALRMAGLPAGVLALCLTGCISVGLSRPTRVEEVLVRPSSRWFELNRVALIDVGGFIGTDTGFLRGGTSVADVKEKLKRAADDGRVKAVVLRINSAGGTAAASDMVCQEVLKFKQDTGKPVVAALMGTAASGGYYVALGADRIVALPTTVTGSIGVALRLFNVEGLFGKLGLRSEVIKSGQKKDIASMFRPMTPEERQVLQGVISALFDRFRQTLRARRPQVTDADLEKISDGRILTAQQALELHLVDRIGYLDDAIDEAIRLAGIPDADVILYRAFPSYNQNIYALSPGSGNGLEEGMGRLLGERQPAFLYLWTP